MTQPTQAAAVKFIVSSRYRPKRVAFLIDPERIFPHELNQIMRYSVQCWAGGKSQGIFPTNGSVISDSWWKALVGLDPDIIYSILPLDAGLTEQINQTVKPLKIISKERPLSYRENLIQPEEIKALRLRGVFDHSGSVLPKPPLFVYVKGNAADDDDESFILRNFGMLPDDGITQEICNGVQSWELDSSCHNAQCALVAVLGIRGHVPDMVTPLDLCRSGWRTPDHFKRDPFMEEFHVVVGDSPHDGMYAWNRGLIQESPRLTFWLPESVSEHEKITELVGKWIRKSSYGSHGKVVSYSLCTEPLKKLSDRMKELTGIDFEPVHLQPKEFPFPAIKQQERTPKCTGIMEVLKYYCSNTSRGFSGASEEISDHVSKPLLGSHLARDIFPDWGWMMDFEIFETNSGENLSERINASEVFGSDRPSRIAANGFLSAAVDPRDRFKGISLSLR